MSEYCEQCLKYDKCDNSNCCEKAYKQSRIEAIDEYQIKLWEDISTRYKNDMKFEGHISSEHLLVGVYDAICHIAKQLKEQ